MESVGGETCVGVWAIMLRSLLKDHPTQTGLGVLGLTGFSACVGYMQLTGSRRLRELFVLISSA